MRRLNRKKTLNLMKELDAFPKVPESYVETSTSGGTVSLIAFTAMALLTILEFMVYRDTWMKYEYEVDKDFTSKLRINIDITVAMKCQYVGADVLDLAETMVVSADGLVYEPVIFDLTPQQREWQRMLQLIQSRLQEEHSLQDVIFKSAFKSASTALPPREDNSLLPPDACRIHGHLYVNKVAGNFHITVGKAIPHPRGHAHLAALVSHDSYNFSHRIDHLSFGELIPGIINPLDGTEKIASDQQKTRVEPCHVTLWRLVWDLPLPVQMEDLEMELVEVTRLGPWRRPCNGWLSSKKKCKRPSKTFNRPIPWKDSLCSPGS
ncbi:endoplasmic reticulum-Golgi intermediate compartment protein 2 isoform X3 [Eretmochelys imbricata]